MKHFLHHISVILGSQRKKMNLDRVTHNNIEGRSQSWPPFFPGMESNLGVFGFTRKVRVSTASFCDMSVFLTAQVATSATHIKVIARVICIAHSPHLFSAKSRIPPNCSPCREKNLRGRYWNFGISVSISVVSPHCARRKNYEYGERRRLGQHPLSCLFNGEKGWRIVICWFFKWNKWN